MSADSREAVKVIVRCRPLSEREQRDGRRQAVEVAGQALTVKSSSQEGEKTFTFDQVFGPESRQEVVYAAAAAPLVDAMLQGFNATVFAYGQTGCGKTHTMEGREVPAEERGIIPRAFEHVFSEIQGAASREFLVRVSHLEIYNEEVRDLLSKDPTARLELRESPERGVHVRGLKEFVVKSAAEMAAVLEVGKKNRSVGATLMNQDSSRSHSIFTIVVETFDKGGAEGGGRPASARPASGRPSSVSPTKGGGGGGAGGIRVGKLNLVDLAGSERQAKTGATGERLKEATRINLSLSALGNVISALTDAGAAHVPYRDSKLTRLLQDSLGGNSKTVMIANVGPADYSQEETVSTLRYASRAKFIRNRPRVNEDPKDAMLREFQEEIARLRAQLAERQQARAASAGGTPAGGSPDKAGALGPGGGGAPGEERGGGSGQAQSGAGAEAGAAAIRQSVRADLERQLRRAATTEALAKARQAIEAQARQRLEAELAGCSASLEERQQAAALLGVQQAELQAYAAELEREQRERLALQQRLQAMESKVLKGGENLLDKVEALEAAAARQQEALAAQRAAAAAAEARIAQLEATASEMEGRYSSVQEEIAAKAARLQRVAAATAAARQEAAALATECQAERERLLDEIRRLNAEMKKKDLIISASIPPEYQALIMSRCRWEEGPQHWAVDHIQWAGNLARARREGSLSGSEASAASSASSPRSARSAFGDGGSSSSFGAAGGLEEVLHGASSRLENVYFSCADAQAGSPPRRPDTAAPPSPGSPAGRPRTAALQARASLRPFSALGR